MGEDRQKCCPFQGLFPAPLLSWDPVVLEEKGCSPGMSPPSREELGEGSELSVTFPSQTFLEPAGSETLQLILSPAPSSNVGTCPSCFPSSHLIATAVGWSHPQAAWEHRHSSENLEGA